MAPLNCQSRSLDLEPASGAYRNTLGVLLYRLGQYPEAIACLEGNERDNAEAAAFDWFVVAACYHMSGRPDQAPRWFDRAAAWERRQTILSPRGRAELAALHAEVAGVMEGWPPKSP